MSEQMGEGSLTCACAPGACVGYKLDRPGTVCRRDAARAARDGVEVQPPRIRDRWGEQHDDYDAAIRALAAAVRTGTRVSFEYHHYSAFDVVVSHHQARVYALSVGYTGSEPKTVVWEPERDASGDIAVALGVNLGHDAETIARLLDDLRAAIERAREADRGD